MITIVERGTLALQKYIDKLPEAQKPMGGVKAITSLGWTIVTAADFDKFARVIRKHVADNQKMVHVLDEHGKLVAVIEPRKL